MVYPYRQERENEVDVARDENLFLRGLLAKVGEKVGIVILYTPHHTLP